MAKEVATVWPKIILEPSDAEITMDAIQRLLTTGSTAVTLMCRCAVSVLHFQKIVPQFITWDRLVSDKYRLQLNVSLC